MLDSLSKILHTVVIEVGNMSLADKGVILAFFLAPFAVLGVVFAAWPLWSQWKKRRLLEKQFGSEFFAQQTINLSTRYYIPPHCSDIDPTQEAELRHTFPVRELLFDAIDRFLSDETPYRHCIVLADSGMGKTSFVLNYYARNQQRSASRRHRLAIVPLGIRNVLQRIEAITNQEATVLFLDAFDEDTEAIADHHQRLYRLMSACEKFKRVLITCRTQFFPTAQEIPEKTGLIEVGPRLPDQTSSLFFGSFICSLLMTLRSTPIYAVDISGIGKPANEHVRRSTPFPYLVSDLCCCPIFQTFYLALRGSNLPMTSIVSWLINGSNVKNFG